MEHKLVMKQPERLSIYGKTPWELRSFLVQVDPGQRENVTIDAYKDDALFDTPACALACECESEAAAKVLVANIHYAVVGYLTNRARKHQIPIKDTREPDPSERAWEVMVGLETIVNLLLNTTPLRAQMMNNEILRPFYDELADILQIAALLRSSHKREEPQTPSLIAQS
ncbi:MAG: hypothetical protein NT047_00715 [Deltaproteobacteria bacterium]|nr:hypothetical protein [Deltaproteobacteria bacterium]